MKSEKKVSEIFILELNPKEIQWLKALCQNPIIKINFPDHETVETQKMRGCFWGALNI